MSVLIVPINNWRQKCPFTVGLIPVDLCMAWKVNYVSLSCHQNINECEIEKSSLHTFGAI